VKTLLLAVLLILPACASDGPPDPAAPPGASAPDERPVLDLATVVPTSRPAPAAEPRGRVPEGDDPRVAEVDGAGVRASEVARFLFRYDPGRALECLNQILDARILEADAAERGITVSPEEVEARVEEEVRSREREIRVQFGPGVDMETWLRERFGFSLAAYRADLAVLMRLQGLKERVVRFEAAREDRIRFRVLLVADEAAAREAARRLRDGADFTALAKQVSLFAVDDLPSYRREEIESAELAEELFAMGPGEISRPVRVTKGGKEIFQVFKVVERSAARDLPWSALAAEIEKGLRERPVGLPEYVQWARRARERHGVKVHLEEPETKR
jgi:hypothetical protein